MLQRFDQNQIEIIINTETGEGFATAKGYSRMSGKEYDAIKKRCQRGGLPSAEIPTEQGFRWGTLISEDLIAEWLPKDNPEMATQLMKLGTRLFLHKMAGYEVTSNAIAQPVRQGLPQRDTIDYVKAAALLPTLKVNAQLKALLEDALTDDLELMRNQRLLGAGKREYTIVKVRAKELGYSTEQIKNGSGLGRFVANIVPVAFSKRIGDYDVNHYEVGAELDDAIHAYFR